MVQTVRIIKKEKPDVIHCHSAKGGMIGRICGFRHKILRCFYTPHAFFISLCRIEEKELGIPSSGENRTLEFTDAGLLGIRA